MSLLQDPNNNLAENPGEDPKDLTPNSKRVRLLAILSAAAIAISCISLIVASGAKDKVTADEAVASEIQAEVRDQINLSTVEQQANKKKIEELEKNLAKTSRNLGLVNKSLQKKITDSDRGLRGAVRFNRKERLRFQTETNRKITNLWSQIDRLWLESRETNLRIDRLNQRISALEN